MDKAIRDALIAQLVEQVLKNPSLLDTVDAALEKLGLYALRVLSDEPYDFSYKGEWSKWRVQILQPRGAEAKAFVVVSWADGAIPRTVDEHDTAPQTTMLGSISKPPGYTSRTIQDEARKLASALITTVYQ